MKIDNAKKLILIEPTTPEEYSAALQNQTALSEEFPGYEVHIKFLNETKIFNRFSGIADHLSAANESFAEALFHPSFKNLTREQQAALRTIADLLSATCDDFAAL